MTRPNAMFFNFEFLNSMGSVACLNLALKMMSAQQRISRPKIEASSFLPKFQ